MKYTIVIEKAPNNYAAYAPPISPAVQRRRDTRDEVVELMREAIEFHLEGLRRDGDPVPPPSNHGGPGRPSRP